MVEGASAGRRTDVLGDNNGVRGGNEKSGHERGDSGAVESSSDWYAGIDWSWLLMNWAR
jgi:hypothetical protein